MKKIRLKKLVVNILVLTLVFTLLLPSLSALANEGKTVEEGIQESVNVSEEDVESKIKYELNNFADVNLTKEEAEENYRVYQDMTSSEKEEFVEVLNSPEKLEQAIEKSGELEIVEAPNLLKASAKKYKTVYVPMKVMGITWMKWGVRATYTTSGSKVSTANGITSWMDSRHLFFILYNSKILDQYCYVSGGNYKGRVRANIQGGYGSWGFQVMRMDFTISVNYKGTGSYVINSAKML
ncbi:hypothetical protein E3Z46_02425 [Listeria monocytogenes]|uniref:hypothetical protein n=1 Tax=Listeria monocytogenes TaxID=1639 RepID=UPI00087480E1|nr:hypothetical protein [Listeria monocytogenes]EAC3359078.1 hypothetical protein [Listeria monocytogenes]EAD9142320.1 hypothetical protein [Listeria monocytogenes]EAE5924507.1 hypothetical protein [Listeria monocytogenes]EAE5994877.1 hypothetical protein [Listeria monocytogenes]EAE7073728.1 hypothetical protein [Listeria monocytogenes]